MNIEIYYIKKMGIFWKENPNGKTDNETIQKMEQENNSKMDPETNKKIAPDTNIKAFTDKKESQNK